MLIFRSKTLKKFKGDIEIDEFYFGRCKNKLIGLISESNATILAQNVKNVKLDSYENYHRG